MTIRLAIRSRGTLLTHDGARSLLEALEPVLAEFRKSTDTEEASEFHVFEIKP